MHLPPPVKARWCGLTRLFTRLGCRSVLRLRMQALQYCAGAGLGGVPGLTSQKALLGCQLRVQQQQQRRHAASTSRRGPARVQAFFGRKDGHSVEPEPVVSEKLALLLNYVQEVEPGIVENFQDVAPPQVTDAMTQAVSNLVGTLPAQFFRVTVATHGENLAQLLFSVMMTGYLFRNAQYRLELTHSLALPAPRSTSSSSSSASSASALTRGPSGLGLGLGDASGTSFFPLDTGPGGEFAPGTQKSRVRGEVIRWNNATGPEAIPAGQYIESLEEELRVLRQQLAQHRTLVKQAADPEASGRNTLLEYLKSLEASALEELTACADDDTVEAINTFIHRVLGTSTNQELRRVTSESDAEELSHLLYYLMVVGYLLRTLEVRFYLDGSTSIDDGDSDGGGSSDGKGKHGGGLGGGPLLWGL